MTFTINEYHFYTINKFYKLTFISPLGTKGHNNKCSITYEKWTNNYYVGESHTII